jgi:hypothetical protein
VRRAADAAAPQEFLVPLIVISGVFAFAFAPLQDRGLLLFGPVFLLSYWACVVPHELGHAFVASLLRLRVFSICLGWFGAIIWRWRIFRTDICVTSIPSGGFTMVAPPSLFLIRLRWPLMVAAGPLTNLLLAFGAWSIPTHSETLELIIPPFVTANLALATLTLLPRQYATRLGTVASDGLALLTSPFASRAVWKKRRGLYFAYEALEGIQQKDSSFEWAQQGLREYPDDNRLRSVLGLAQLGAEDFTAARQTFVA